VLYLSITIFAFGSTAIYPPSSDFLVVVNALSPKPFAPVKIVLDLPLPLAISVADKDVACETSTFVGVGAGGGGGGDGRLDPPILFSS